ncbi:MAG: class II glutamine amidotransferase [Gammaproteobacteria bacterium]
MCRLAAYIGPELLLSRLLEEPPHSLIQQSWAPEEMNEARLNADGFGFGWTTRNHQALRYTSILPIWSDTNLTALGQSLKSSVWLANVRSATPGQDLGRMNTQPFIYSGFMFLHNGYLQGFDTDIKRRFHERLSAEVQTGIQGNTDSEFLFALFRQCMNEGPADTGNGLIKALESLTDLLDGTVALLNIVLYDGKNLLACRYAMNGGECPSLYYTWNHPHFPKATLVASEPFSMPECWREVDKHCILVFAQDAPCRSLKL